ncbi:MAG: hypothetical protein ACRDTM_17610 [Micromonosporaceae bacterium]
MDETARQWRGEITGVVYAVQFDPRPVDAVDRLMELIVATDALAGPPERYAASIKAALASTEPLARLIPQPHSEGAIRQMLGVLGGRLDDWLRRPPQLDVLPVEQWRPGPAPQLVAHLKREPGLLSRWLGVRFSRVEEEAFAAQVAVLRLSSGYVVALIQLVGNPAPGTTLFQADERPAADVLAEFLEETKLPRAVVDWQGQAEPTAESAQG